MEPVSRNMIYFTTKLASLFFDETVIEDPEIYIRDKPKYLTLNSNNLNNYRYSEINNFFTMDYAECFDISPILDPS